MQDCFQAKDHLNFRYHTKRAMYLTILASKLSTWEEIASVQFGRIGNDPFKPILIIKPAGMNNLLTFYINLFKGSITIS